MLNPVRTRVRGLSLMGGGGPDQRHTRAVANWHHRRPKSYYADCVKMFGQPDAIANTRHGFAYWKTKGLFDEHLLRDEDVKHCVPRPHHDYFYSSLVFFIPKDRVMDVLRISGSINYDGLKKLLTARCGGIGANYATLYLGMLVGSGKLSIAEVKKNDLYPRMIRGEVMPYSEMKKKMYAMKRANHKQYAKELAAEFAPYAYSECYKATAKGGGGGAKTNRRRARRGKQTRKHRQSLRNTRGKPCAARDFTACCPHNPPDARGRYAATNEKSVLKLRGKKYALHTCCLMCADAMNALAAKDPAKFERQYVARRDAAGAIMAKNPHTGKVVQKLMPL